MNLKLKNPHWPKTLDDLVEKVRATKEIRTMLDYRIKGGMYNFPPIPHLIYKEEAKTRAEIEKAFFGAVIQKKKKILVNEEYNIFEKKTLVRQEDVAYRENKKVSTLNAPYRTNTSNKDENGYLFINFLIEKIKKSNIDSQEVYHSYAQLFIDWPDTPSSYYSNQPGWDLILKNNINVIKNKIKNHT